MQHTSRIAHLIAAAGLALAAAAASARPEPAHSDQPLGGPKVEDRAVPGSSSTFGDGKSADKKARQRPIPHPVFMRVVRSLSAEETPEGLRLSADQEQKIRAVSDEFQQQVRAFRDAHQDEIQQLREKAGVRERRGPGGPPPDGAPAGGEQRKPRRAPEGGKPGGGDDAMNDKPSPESAEAREKLRALMEQAPKPDDCHAKIWAVLSEQQQGALKDRLEDARRNADDMMNGDRFPRRGQPGNAGGPGEQRRRGPKGDQPPPPPPPGRGGDDQGAFRAPPPPPRDGPGPERFARERGPWRNGPRAEAFGPDDRMPPPPPDGDRAPRARRGPDGPGGPGPGPDGPVTLDDLRERLDRLPPEARDRVLRRMIGMLDNARERMPARRPPPPMDEVDVPKMD